jgi:hypothetical protein
MVTESDCPGCPELGVSEATWAGGSTVNILAKPVEEKAAPEDVTPPMFTA